MNISFQSNVSNSNTHQQQEHLCIGGGEGCLQCPLGVWKVMRSIPA